MSHPLQVAAGLLCTGMLVLAIWRPTRRAKAAAWVAFPAAYVLLVIDMLR